MMKPGPDLIDINDYHYDLPEDRIAKYPLTERDQSKLIIYKDQQIGSGSFRDLPQHIPDHSVMVFNETRVIQARLVFRKESGARIEIFCLEPADHNGVSELAFQQESPVTWKCLVGNARKWKKGRLEMDVGINNKNTRLYARMIRPVDNAFLIEFSWEGTSLGFSEILDAAGKVPLPPYIKRDGQEDDKYRYQTIYARNDGSVAAPTAGLHFTELVLEQLLEKEISFQKLTLHVSAGTFKPVSASSIRDHVMHDERVIFSRSFIENIRSNMDHTMVAVGTTSVRSVESLYWLGHKLILMGVEPDRFHVGQWEPYETGIPDVNPKDALSAILEYMRVRKVDNISGNTQLIIIPGYRFRFVDALVTNFHMPKSTLLLLVAAMVGDRWREIYHTALDNDFRFLSYGDSCLFFPEGQKRVSR